MATKVNFNKLIKEDFDFNSVDVNDSTADAYGVYGILHMLYNTLKERFPEMLMEFEETGILKAYRNRYNKDFVYHLFVNNANTISVIINTTGYDRNITDCFETLFEVLKYSSSISEIKVNNDKYDSSIRLKLDGDIIKFIQLLELSKRNDTLTLEIYGKDMPEGWVGVANKLFKELDKAVVAKGLEKNIILDYYGQERFPALFFTNKAECESYLASQGIFLPDTEYMREQLKTSDLEKFNNVFAGKEPGVWRGYINALKCSIPKITLHNYYISDDSTKVDDIELNHYGSSYFGRNNIKLKIMEAFRGIMYTGKM